MKIHFISNNYGGLKVEYNIKSSILPSLTGDSKVESIVGKLLSKTSFIVSGTKELSTVQFLFTETTDGTTLFSLDDNRSISDKPFIYEKCTEKFTNHIFVKISLE